MFFFQTPLADIVVPMNDLAFIDGLWADWSPGYDATEDIAHVKDALRDPANLAAALGYYRAIFGTSAADRRTRRQPPQPLLYLPRRDRRLHRRRLVGRRRAPPRRWSLIIDGAGHFLHVEKPDEVKTHPRVR